MDYLKFALFVCVVLAVAVPTLVVHTRRYCKQKREMDILMKQILD